MKGIVNRFVGRWGHRFEWVGARVRHYAGGDAPNVTETWLIGKAENATNFAMRYYEVEEGGRTAHEAHPHDHGILILRGKAKVLLGDEWVDVAQGDVVYIPPNLVHQLANAGQEPLGFLCVIPASRMKDGKAVWAEEDL